MVSDRIKKKFICLTIKVLILVVMEYGLWRNTGRLFKTTLRGLNPCCNGIWSLTSMELGAGRKAHVLILVLMEDGLWLPIQSRRASTHVLILVLMEDGLWLCAFCGLILFIIVLILVLMEDGLWPDTAKVLGVEMNRLNPCCNGIWSLTHYEQKQRKHSAES